MKNLNDTKAGHDCVRRIISGERQAENDFFNFFFEKLRIFFISKLYINENSACDLVMESLSNAFNAIKNGKYSPDYKVSSWLYTIAKNKAIDHRRRKAKLKTINFTDLSQTGKDGDVLEFDAEDRSYDFFKDINRKDQQKTLDKILAKLPFKHQKMISLRYSEDKKYKDCAEEMKEPIGTIKATLFRIHKTLSEDPEIISLRVA